MRVPRQINSRKKRVFVTEVIIAEWAVLFNGGLLLVDSAVGSGRCGGLV